MSRAWVKVCGISSVADARLAEAAGADAIGIVLTAGDPRAIRLDAAAEIAASVTIEVVAVLGAFDGDALRDVRLAVAPGRVQVEGAMPVGPLPLPWYRARGFGGRADLAALARVEGDRVLLRLDPAILPGGRLWGRDRTLLQEVGRAAAVVVAAPAPPAVLLQVLAEVRPAGVDLREAVERQPGLLDAGRLRDAVEAVRRA